MTTYTFELGFDLSMLATPGGVLSYPLQWGLIDENQEMVSPMHLGMIQKDDTLAFRIYNVTEVDPEASTWQPGSFQALFSSATEPAGAQPFSPIDEPQIITLTFTSGAPTSVVFGAEVGWVVGGAGTTPTIANDGRFELRMLVTVESPGEEARIYHVDPEMVVGPTGTGGPPASS